MAWNTGLTGAHLNIASYQGPSLRVMAGPGTGKTYAIMRRVARLLESGVPPSQILVVSFTRTAASDLVSQLQALNSPGANLVEARTLHSLSFEMLQKGAVFKATGRIARPLLEYEVDCLGWDLASAYGGKTAVDDLVKAFEAAWATTQNQQPGWPQNPVQQNFERDLLGWLQFHGAILIGELVPVALDYVRSNPASPDVPSYQHVLADEYQDLNRADQELIDKLARQGTITVIGDEDQAIYTLLRHAQPSSIAQFHVSHPNTHDEALQDCQRCPTQVVSIANAVILQNHPQKPSTINALPTKGPGDVYVVQHTSIQEEVTNSAAYVDWYLTSHPEASPGDVLLLSTRRGIGNAIRDELIRLGRVAQSFFADQSLDKRSAREGMALLMLLVTPGDRAALRAWLGVDKADARAPAYRRIWQAASAGNVSVRQLLDDIVAGRTVAPPFTGQVVQRYGDLTTRIGQIGAATGVALVDLLWPPIPDNIDIRGLALTIAGTSPNAPDLLEELISSITQPELPGAGGNTVRIMSLHKSKGLTAKCVLVVGCVAGALPSIKPGMTPAQVQQAAEEQRRLFYVAITRATQTLVLSSAATCSIAEAKQMGLLYSRVIRGQMVVLQASPFMSQLGQQAPVTVTGAQWRGALGF